MKKYLLSCLIITFSSCAFQTPITSQPPSNNQTYTVQYLFEHEGCKVYRFYDLGNYVYFTNCSGETIAKQDSIEIRNSTKIIQKNK